MTNKLIHSYKPQTSKYIIISTLLLLPFHIFIVAINIVQFPHTMTCHWSRASHSIPGILLKKTDLQNYACILLIRLLVHDS